MSAHRRPQTLQEMKAEVTFQLWEQKVETNPCLTCTELLAGILGDPRTPPLISLSLNGLWAWLVGGTVDSERTPVTQTQRAQWSPAPSAPPPPAKSRASCPTGSALLSQSQGQACPGPRGWGSLGAWAQHLCSERGGRGGEGSRPWWRCPTFAP